MDEVEHPLTRDGVGNGLRIALTVLLKQGREVGRLKIDDHIHVAREARLRIERQRHRAREHVVKGRRIQATRDPDENLDLFGHA
jgi:hypothetical protein